MSTVRLKEFEHALRTAEEWVHDIAIEFHTEDRHFAFRVLRAWLHTVRDLLPVTSAARFAAQLPELLRGVYYEGWNPATVPVAHDVTSFTARFAHDAAISAGDVPKAAAAVTNAAQHHLTHGLIAKVLAQLPMPLRALLVPPVPSR